MKVLLTLFSLSTVFSLAAQATIVEVSTLKEALEHATPGALVALDFDNTIMMAAQSVGGEEWFDHLVEKFTADYRKAHPKAEAAEVKAAAISELIPLWNMVVARTKMKPAEVDGPSVVASAQKNGIQTIGLTARSMDNIEYTLKQLEDVGFHLMKAAPIENEWQSTLKGRTTYKKGVLFVGPENGKGEVLVAFLKAHNLSPKKIIFVDNKRSHLENVERALEPLGVDYVGCRLGVTDKKIAAFRPELAEIQLKYVLNVMDDETAERLGKQR